MTVTTWDAALIESPDTTSIVQIANTTNHG